MPRLGQLGGHAWTVWPLVRDRLRAPARRGTPWTTEVGDPALGRLRLSGRLDHVAGADAVVVIVHGMGGSADRPYCLHAAAAARAAGLSSLRLNLRGADGTGADLYHIGLVDDLEAAIASPEIARHRSIFALGFSLGGHIALRLAALGRAPSLRAVASVCAPLDVAACSSHIDQPAAWPYRRHLLAGLKAHYGEVAARREVPEPVSRARAIRSIRQWDDRVVAPRFGFASALDYYERSSVGPLLASMAVPTLVVASESDPMVPTRTLLPALAAASGAVQTRWLRRGGHVGFPSEMMVLGQIMEWFGKQR